MIRVSVVVPAYNEEELLPDCLDALLAQDFPGEMEILVVDNASTDGTGEVAHRRGVTLIEERKRGYGEALIRGFAAATGDILALTDADTVVPHDWISQLVREYEADPGVVAVGGEVEFCCPNLMGRVLTCGLLPLLNRLDRTSATGPHLFGANLSVRRDAFLRAGGWNPAFNLQTDSELSERMRTQGRVMLRESIRVRTSCRRWNRAPITSLALFGSNFLALRLLKRPLWREFPAIRGEGRRRSGGGTRRGRGVRLAVAGVAMVIAVGVGVPAYEAFTPWSSAFGKTYWCAPTSRRVIALTFDDGPEEPYTSEVLAILRSENIRATFFLVGENVRRFPETAARTAREGHAIGNHSDTHMLAMEPPGRLRIDLAHAEETIHQSTGIWPRLFRPPKGLRSPWLMRVLAEDSLLAVTWDDAPHDWEQHSTKQLVEATIRQAHPGAIILLHDGLNLSHMADRSATVRALPGIIKSLRAEGYEFLTLPELLGQPKSLAAWAPRPSRRDGLPTRLLDN